MAVDLAQHVKKEVFKEQGAYPNSHHFNGARLGQWQETVALAQYEALTGHAVSACRFRVLRDDCAHGWLGASPDGLVDGLTATPGEPWRPGIWVFRVVDWDQGCAWISAL